MIIVLHESQAPTWTCHDIGKGYNDVFKPSTLALIFLLLVKCAHSIFRLALKLLKVRQSLLSLSDDCLFYALTSRLDSHLEWLRAHVQAITDFLLAEVMSRGSDALTCSQKYPQGSAFQPCPAPGQG